MKSRSLAAVVAAAALLLAGCSATPAEPTAPSENDPFTVLYVAGFSGQLASLTEAEVRSINIAADEINEDGGILGRKVVIETLDDKSDPTEAVSVLQKRLTTEPKPDLIRTGISSPEALAMLPVTTRAGIATFTPAASALIDDVEAYPLTKSVTSGFTRATEIIKAYVQDKKYKKLAVFVPGDASGDSVLASAKELYKGTGVTIQEARYNTADIDLSVAYQRAIADEPDAIYANCIGATCPRIITARGSVAGGTDVPMLGDTSMASSPGGLAASATADLVENVLVAGYTIQVDEPDAQAPGFPSFYEKLLKFGDPAVMTPQSTVYDGLKMFAAGAEKAKSTDGAKMIKAINDIEWEPGAFVSFGMATVDWNDDSTFPTISEEGLVMFQVSPLKKGLYPPLDVFIP